MSECAPRLVSRRQMRSVPEKFCFVRMVNGRKYVLGQIKDMNIHGLAFHYVPETGYDSLYPVPNQIYRLDLFQSGVKMSLSELTVWVVYDVEQRGSLSYFSLPPRRCGVMFQNLTPEQRERLQDYLEAQRKK